jgi:fibronectin type 3 domain-containing protein
MANERPTINDGHMAVCVCMQVVEAKPTKYPKDIQTPQTQKQKPKLIPPH